MSRFSQTIRKTKGVIAFLSRHMVAVNLILFILTAAMTVSYVIQVNTSATKGYRLRELENSINQLKLSNQSMQVKIAGTRSMENIAAKVPMLGMIKAGTPQYVSGALTTVSMNR